MSNAAENLESQDEDFDVRDQDTTEEDSGLEIEVVDDTPEEDRNRPRRAEDAKPDIPDDNEVEKYSEGVQKRIKQLRYEYHEERRAKEEAARLREEALKYAEQVKSENERLRKSLEENEDVLLTQAKTRLDAQLDRAKAAYKAAYESGDPDALLEAQAQLTDLQNEKFRIQSYRPQRRQPEQEFTPPPAEAQPQIAKPDAKALAWADDNEWFGKDKRMTGYAFGVHEELVTNGVAPNTEEYYNEIDAAMRRAFPDKFAVVAEEPAPQQRQAGNVVAPPSRTAKTPRKVKLTPSAVALAKRLGLTPEQYAAQLMKDS